MVDVFLFVRERIIDWLYGFGALIAVFVVLGVPFLAVVAFVAIRDLRREATPQLKRKYEPEPEVYELPPRKHEK